MTVMQTLWSRALAVAGSNTGARGHAAPAVPTGAAQPNVSTSARHVGSAIVGGSAPNGPSPDTPSPDSPYLAGEVRHGGDGARDWGGTLGLFAPRLAYRSGLGPRHGRSHGLVIDAGPLYMRPPAASDYREWAALRMRNRKFLAPWEPSWTSDELTRAAYRRRLRFYSRELREETGYSFLLFQRADHAMVGGISLSNVRRGVTQSGVLGYWLGEEFSRRGHMTVVVRALCRFAFAELNLHRIEAACLPDNAASARVLEKVGFQREGRARQNLKINGIWQDHYLFGLIAGDLD